MAEVIGVRFKEVGKIYYFDPKNVKLKADDLVIVETARGIECGKVALANKEVPDEEILHPLKPLIRKATENDISHIAENKKREDVLSKPEFAKLEGVEAFDELRADMSKYDVETLEDKCYAILGRMNSSAKFSLETKSPKLPVGNTQSTDEPYGGIFTKYGIAD